MSPVTVLIHAMGVLVFCAHAAMALLSYVQAPLLWQLESSPQSQAFFERIANSYPPDSLAYSIWMGIRAALPGEDAIALVSFVPLGLATFAFVALYVAIGRMKPQDNHERLAVRWAIGFALVSLFSYPVFTQDFWLSAVWGRMIANGQNPYHQVFSEADIAGLPLDHFPMPMTYGPIWAILSGAIMKVIGSYAGGIFIAFKLALGALWVLTVWLVPKIMKHNPLNERLVAVLIVGWLPMSVWQTVAEGHNDIALATFALVWLSLLMKNKGGAPFALSASVLCKYSSAPLLLIDFVASLRLNRLSFWQFVKRWMLPGAASLLALALFIRSSAYFDGLAELNTWRGLRPVDGIMALETTSGAPLLILQVIVFMLFPMLAAVWLYWLYKTPTQENAAKAALAMMCAVLFSGISHIWPWYLIWPLAFAAVLPKWWLSRFVVGVALLSPFTLALWWVESIENYKDVGALILYGGGVLWMIATTKYFDTTRQTIVFSTVGKALEPEKNKSVVRQS